MSRLKKFAHDQSGCFVVAVVGRRVRQQYSRPDSCSQCPDPYIHGVNTSRTVLLYAVAAIVGILLGLATAQVTVSCSGSCAGTQPRFPVWQSGLIGLACAVVVLVACALLDEEFIPVTRQWLRGAHPRKGGGRRKEQPR